MKNYRVYLATLAAVVGLATSCKKSDTGPEGDVVNKDVSYGAGAAQKMDVYLPASRSSDTTKVIVLVHGGAWTSGDKADFDSVVLALKAQLPSYAIFNINYSLATITGANLWPGQMDDVNSALSFIIGKKAEYRVNTGKIIMLGASAGAHLALLQAYRFNTGGNIKAVVDLFGPADIVDLYNHPADPAYPQLLSIWLKGTPTTAAAAYTAASPIQHITTQAPPTIIFHGTADDVVPIGQSAALKAALTTKGVTNEYYTYNGQKHGWVGTDLLDTYTKAIAFITKTVQ